MVLISQLLNIPLLLSLSVQNLKRLDKMQASTISCKGGAPEDDANKQQQTIPGSTAWLPQGVAPMNADAVPAMADGGTEADDEGECWRGDAPVFGPEPCGAVRDLFAARSSSDVLSHRLPDVDLTEVRCGMVGCGTCRGGGGCMSRCWRCGGFLV